MEIWMRDRKNNKFSKERKINLLDTILLNTIYINKSGFWRAEYLRKRGAFYSMGENCYYHPRKVPADAFLISIGNNVSIATNVTFFCHDVFCQMLSQNRRYSGDFEVHFDTITIGDDVCIGGNVTILPGVWIGNNSIIGAGTVVTKNVEEGTIVCGNPGEVVGTVDNLAQKRQKTEEKCRMSSTREEFTKLFNK